MVIGCITSAIAVQEALQSAEVEAYAYELTEQALQGAIEASVASQAPASRTSFGSVVKAASTASKSGRLWGLLSTLTDKLALAAYVEAAQRETVEDDLFRWQ